jgi:hypothetical protein
MYGMFVVDQKNASIRWQKIIKATDKNWLETIIGTNYWASKINLQAANLES